MPSPPFRQSAALLAAAVSASGDSSDCAVGLYLSAESASWRIDYPRLSPQPKQQYRMTPRHALGRLQAALVSCAGVLAAAASTASAAAAAMAASAGTTPAAAAASAGCTRCRSWFCGACFGKQRGTAVVFRCQRTSAVSPKLQPCSQRSSPPARPAPHATVSRPALVQPLPAACSTPWRPPRRPPAVPR